MRAFLDDIAQILGPTFDPEKKAEGRSEREERIAGTVLEKASVIVAAAEKIGGVKSVNPVVAFLEHLVYKTKYSRISEGETLRCGAGPESFPNEELAIRQAIINCCNSLVRDGLVQGTWGNVSVRTGEKEMLVTPSGIDYDKLTPDEIIRVNTDTLKFEPNGNLKPTSEKSLHAGIYKLRPDVGCIIHTHSTWCSVFAAALKDHPHAKLAKYGTSGSEKLAKATAEALGDGIGAIMAHHGMVAVGKDMKTAYENALKLENEAKEILL